MGDPFLLRLLWSAGAGGDKTMLRCLFLSFLLLLSCAKPPSHKPKTLRIVSLAPSVTETLFSMGAGDAVIAVTNQCNYPPIVKNLPRIGAYADPDPERILALKPTLVIGTTIPSHKRVLEALLKRGISVLCVPESGLEGVRGAIKRIGQTTGYTRQADRLLTELEKAIRAARLAARGKKRLRVLFLVGHEPFVAAASGTLPADLLKIAGAIPLPEKAVGYITVSLERIAAEKPDLIIDSSMGSELNTEEVVIKKLALVIPDIKGKYLTVNPDIFCRSGPRVMLALKKLLEVLDKWR